MDIPLMLVESEMSTESLMTVPLLLAESDRAADSLTIAAEACGIESVIANVSFITIDMDSCVTV